MSDESMPIGALAREWDVKVPTIRFYESIGLMPKAPRTGSGRRLYGQSASRRLGFIRHARDLGFSVEAVRSLLELADQPQRPCAEVDRLAGEHLEGIRQKIAQLEALRDELTRITTECAHNRVADCHVIEVLSDHSLCHSIRHD